MKPRVNYVKSRYKDKIYITPLIVTSYRDENNVPRNITLANLSKLPEPIVALIDNALKNNNYDALAEYTKIDKIEYLKSISIGSVFVIIEFIKRLNLLNVLKSFLTKTQIYIIIFFLVERVISKKPRSILSLHRNFLRNALSYYLDIQKCSRLKTWYSTIGKLEKCREKILTELYKNTKHDGTLFLYDITSSYFEGVTCPISEYGYNRDGKKGKLQIVIGVICDNNGRPIWVDTFKGSTSDQTTVKVQIETLRDKLGVKKLIFVGDRGMLTSSNLEKFEKEEWWEYFEYITALKRSEMMRLIEEPTHPLQLDLFNEKELGEVEYDGIRYVLCHNPLRKKEDENTRERLLEKTKEKLDMIKRNVQKGNWKSKDVITKRVYRWINHWNMEKFIKNLKIKESVFDYEIDDKKLEKYKNIDGCYVIKSNIKDKNMLKDKLLEKYKDLKYVEQAFRTMKSTDIHIQPIRHFKVENVRGHVFVCFLSYRIIWELKQKLNKLLLKKNNTQLDDIGAFEDVWEILSEISVGIFKVNGETEYRLSSISKEARSILKSLNIKIKNVVTKYLIFDE